MLNFDHGTCWDLSLLKNSWISFLPVFSLSNRSVTGFLPLCRWKRSVFPNRHIQCCDEMFEVSATSLINYIVMCLLNIYFTFYSDQESINLENFRIASVTALCIYLIKSLPKHMLLITENLIQCWNCGRGYLPGYQYVLNRPRLGVQLG